MRCVSLHLPRQHHALHAHQCVARPLTFQCRHNGRINIAIRHDYVRILCITNNQPISLQIHSSSSVQQPACLPALSACLPVCLSACTCATLHSVERQPEGHAQPGAAITVSAELAPNRAAVTGAQLTYRVNYGAEQTVPMTAAGSAGACVREGARVCAASSMCMQLAGWLAGLQPCTSASPAPCTPYSADNDGRVTYEVDIPPTAFKAGDMVRWAVTVRAVNLN
jgi:hypothetical protein